MKIRHLLLGRKAMTKLDSILKSRDITLLTKVHIVNAMVLPVVMYGCESWTIKKAESWRLDAFELWSWKRLLRVPWTARRSNQSILKKINPEYSLEGVRLKLKIQYFGPDANNRLIRKDTDAGKDWRQKEKGTTDDEMVGWHHQLNGHKFEEALGYCERQGSLACCSQWGCKYLDSTEWLNNNITQQMVIRPEQAEDLDKLSKGWFRQCCFSMQPSSSIKLYRYKKFFGGHIPYIEFSILDDW